MRLAKIVETSQRVADTTGRLEKIGLLAECLRGLAPDEVVVGVSFLSGELRQGRIGIGHAALEKAAPGSAADVPQLGLLEVDEAFHRIAETSGAGSSSERIRILKDLLARASPGEQRFLRSLLIGELRQGAQEGVMIQAVARAAEVPVSLVRRAAMFAGDLPAVAYAALTEGRAGLTKFSIQLFRPLKPMLAQTAEDVSEAIDALGRAALEYKLDGARIQVHRSGKDVAVYSRRLNDVTAAVPEVVEAVLALPVKEIVLDGELLALREDGSPHPFQTTMRRFGRKLNVQRMREELPLAPFFFDCLYIEGDDLIDEPGERRFAALAERAPDGILMPRLVTSDEEEADAFFAAALEAGHEGLMAKDPQAVYKAGGRGKAWLKVKPAHTLDLVVLAAEWGSGRRRGWLSNLHLGARDPESGGFVMLGKTFKGMTDEMLEWQTKRLQELEVSRDDWTVYVRPELVVEIAFNDVQESPHYPGGVALRFARVKRYRPDKSPEQADTIEDVRGVQKA